MDSKKAAEKLAWIKERLAGNMTVYVCTYTRATKITPKTAARWADAGRDLFKIDSTGSLMMAVGNRYDCIDYCGLRAVV